MTRTRWLPALALLLGTAGAQGTYRVQPGDTLYHLARTNKTTVAELQRLNGLTGTTLRVGATLQLPGGQGSAVSNARPVAALPQEAPVAAAPTFQRGLAVYYGGRRDTRTLMTAAHRTLPLGTWVQVTHERTGRSITVLINDRGPFNGGGRIIDLSTTAARALGIIGEGVAPVTLSLPRP